MFIQCIVDADITSMELLVSMSCMLYNTEQLNMQDRVTQLIILKLVFKLSETQLHDAYKPRATPACVRLLIGDLLIWSFLVHCMFHKY